MITKKKTLLYLILVPLASFLSFSSVSAERPLTTDHAETVEKGNIELEVGFDGSRQDNHDREFHPTLTLVFGLIDKLEFAIETGYFFLHPEEGKKENGLGDTELKLKYQLVDEKEWIPAFAMSGILKLPTASESEGLGSGQTDFEMNAIFTKVFTKRWCFHFNLGYTFIGEDHADNELSYSLAARFLVTEKWAWVGEMVGRNNLNGRKGDDPLSSLVGTYYSFNDSITWDAAIEIGMSKAAPDFRITTGLTLLFKP
jgi:hypothetical protein